MLKYFKILGKPDFNLTAKKVGERFPEVKDELLNALQLNSIPDKNIYSSNLISAAFIRIYEKVKPVNFDSAIKFDKVKNLLFYAAGSLVIVLLMYITIPGLKAASNRLVNFNKEFVTPPKFTFEVSPGNTQVTKGRMYK